MTVKIGYIFVSVMFLSITIATSRENSSCFQEGWTWDTSGQLEVLPQVTLHDCVQSYLQNEIAVAFTWFNEEGKTDRFSNVCVIFDKLMGAHECRDCISSYETDDSCVCNQQNGECRIDSDNFIIGLFAESELDCILECSIVDECNFYTWYSLENQEISNECFLFSSCDIVDDCKEQGCCSGCVGPLQCATPTPVTTSGPPLPCPEGWRKIRDRCLYFSKDFEELANNWNDARERCILVSIRDSTDWEQIHELIDGDHTYIGGSDANHEGLWEWADGEPFNFTDWADTEPNGGSNENCIEYKYYDYIFAWNDINCDEDPSNDIGGYYICELTDLIM